MGIPVVVVVVEEGPVSETETPGLAAGTTDLPAVEGGRPVEAEVAEEEDVEPGVEQNRAF